MAKSIMQLEAEIKKMELEKKQLMHKLQLLENRKNYLEQKPQRKYSGSMERAERSHKLITRGAGILSEYGICIQRRVFEGRDCPSNCILSWRGGSR